MARTGASRDEGRAPAAQYIRMSTEHQRYSPEKQVAAIARYAQRHGYEIVRTYIDEGMSGLRLKNRKGLQALLRDVVNGDTGFRIILVYDVSRWGRFQNPDQAAYYEFMCAESGVPVEYVAELFRNDGSLVSSILKSIRRSGAAQFSRDLSMEVANAKLRGSAKGFWQYGPPGFGLRRQMIDEAGRPVMLMQHGERKALQSHRTVLVHGPPDEVALVRRIYRLYLEEKLTRRAIARLLNAEGRRTDLGRPWTFTTVSTVLSNPKYAGDLLYHTRRSRLDGKAVNLPRSEWRRTRSALKPIVSRRMFEAVQKELKGRAVHMTDAQMIEALRGLLAAHGRLDERLVNATPGLPSASCYTHRFGRLWTAFRLAGFEPRRRRPQCTDLGNDEILRRLARLLLQQGKLTAKVVDAADGLPCYATLYRRFGSGRQAVALAGYVPMTPEERLSPVGQARIEAGFARARRLLATAQDPAANETDGQP